MINRWCGRTAYEMIKRHDTSRLLPISFERRLFTRENSRVPAQLGWGMHTVIVDVLDIGRGGAGCELSSSIRPEINNRACLILLDQTIVGAVIRWVSHSNIGLEFDCNLLSPNDHLHYEHLGGQYFSRLHKLQSQRQQQRISQLPHIKD